MWSVLSVCVLVSACVSVCESARILVVFPGAGRDSSLGDAVVSSLLGAGHEVTYISPGTRVPPRAALTHIDISSAVHHAERESPREMARGPQHAVRAGAGRAERALRHHAVRAALDDTEQRFHLVLAEWRYSGLLAPLASVYECPLIWYSSEDASWASLQLVHGATNPAYSAGPLASSLPSGYSMRERLERMLDQLYMTGWMYYMLYYVENSLYESIYRAPLQLRARPLPSYEQLVYNASLLLLNSQPVLGQPVPVPPAAKYVGGHHIQQPTELLPKDLQQVLDRATNGVIYFSLGSDVTSEDLPEYMKMHLIDIFGGMEQTVIWELEEELEGLPDNLYIVHRIPQNSILNHTNTVLFISDGGFQSYMEAMYFGVPMVGVPVSEDQFLTMELMQARGLGRRVRYSDYLPYSLRDAVMKVLRNNRYKSNVDKVSSILRRAPVPPDSELVYWVELVLQHGATHLRSPALHLSTVERLYLDVAIFTLMLLWFLSKVWKVIKVHWNSDTDGNKKIQ